jgi:hypothetical protein
MSLLVAMGGCSESDSAGKETSPPRVATLASETAEAPAKAADTEAKRPRQRLDMTQDEKDQLIKPYRACLAEHGLETEEEVLKMRAERRVSTIPEATVKAAEKACLSLFPLPPWEQDVSNPEASDFVRKVVLCLREKGVSAEVNDDSSDGSVSVSLLGDTGDTDTIDRGMNMTPVCEKQVAGLK